jgi:hypothetical protein
MSLSLSAMISPEYVPRSLTFASLRVFPGFVDSAF